MVSQLSSVTCGKPRTDDTGHAATSWPEHLADPEASNDSPFFISLALDPGAN